ncbi:RNA polymerase sigma factor [Nocardioides sp. MAHUQ-72]|uniref:RNA polymerase sigma factor n=1 Tax=unclassified Nocardioides TaxID=2615069 RepID=UPI003618F5B0
MGQESRGTSTEQRSDAALVRDTAAGDSTALRELYDRHAPWLMARLTRRCNDREVVLDVLQDTFVAVWKDARKWRGDGEVAGWLWGIAFRRMVSRLRGRKDVLLLPDWDRSSTGSVPAAEDQVLLGVEYGHLAGAMRSLSPEFRAVVQAVVLDGLTAREAGQLLGVRQNTVKTRLHRAKAQLRRALAQEPMEGWG